LASRKREGGAKREKKKTQGVHERRVSVVNPRRGLIKKLHKKSRRGRLEKSGKKHQKGGKRRGLQGGKGNLNAN